MIDEKILNDLKKAEEELNDIDKALSSGDIDSNQIKELSKKEIQFLMSLDTLLDTRKFRRQ